MTLLWAIAGFFGVCTVVFVVLCARAPHGEEGPRGFRLTPEPHDLDEHTRLDGDCPWPLAKSGPDSRVTIGARGVLHHQAIHSSGHPASRSGRKGA